MNSEKPTDIQIWWPSPGAFDDLTVHDTEEGWQLSAPDGTELAAWIGYWNQDEEHQKFFNKFFLDELHEHANRTLEQHGKNEGESDKQTADRVQTEENNAGPLS